MHQACIGALGALSLLLTVSFANADEGADKVKSHGCTSCHSVDKTVVGPSFSAIAQKYKGDSKAVEVLVSSVKEGSKGKWGAIPMPPSRLSDDDAKTIVEWILNR